MATNRQVVDFEGMENGKVAFETAYSQADTAKRHITGTISTVPGCWKGPSAVQATNALNAWLQNYNKVVNALFTMKETLTKSIAGYAANEDDNAAIVSSITATLQGMDNLPGLDNAPTDTFSPQVATIQR